MSWQPGDLALCVTHTHLTGQHSGVPQDGPRVGTVYEVQEVRNFPELSYLDCTIGLRIGGFIGLLHAVLFRKIERHTPDAEDYETIRLLNREPAPSITTHWDKDPVSNALRGGG